MNPGAYREARVDINLSSDDEVEHPLMPDALVDQKTSGVYDAGDEGVTSAELTTSSPIGSGVPEKTKPSTVDQVLVVPPSGRRGQKHLHAATRRSIPVHSAG
jgi:hypothetical protein